MESTTKDTTQTRVPPPDGTLDQALAELEAKLNGWQTAMLQTQEYLLAQARTQAETQQHLDTQAREQSQTLEQLKTRAETQAENEKQIKAQAEAQARAAMETRLKEQAEPQPPPSQPVQTPAEPEAAGQTTIENPPAEKPGREWKKHIRVPADTAPSVAPAPEPEVQVQPAEPSEDEVLLASLDPETAQAIRIMRRMSSHKKTVRELLDQYQATQAAGKTEPQKKSWFRRGK